MKVSILVFLELTKVYCKVFGSMGSPYLTDSFMKATEECYADVTYVLEDNFKILVKTLSKKFITSSNIHWLHEI